MPALRQLAAGPSLYPCRYPNLHSRSGLQRRPLPPPRIKLSSLSPPRVKFSKAQPQIRLGEDTIERVKPTSSAEMLHSLRRLQSMESYHSNLMRHRREGCVPPDCCMALETSSTQMPGDAKKVLDALWQSGHNPIARVCYLTLICRFDIEVASHMRAVTLASASKFGLSAYAIATALVLGAACYGTSDASEVSFKDFPYIIYCQYAGIDHAYYFSRLGADGRATYITPDRLAGMITIDGIAQRVGGEQSGTCLNKTLEELRSAGQAYDLSQ